MRELSPEIPWHLNGFVPRYRLSQTEPASAMLLMMAAGAAYVAGSKFVYVSNSPACQELAHTRCPACHAVLVQRRDYEVVGLTLRGGCCPHCSTTLPGLWE